MPVIAGAPSGRHDTGSPQARSARLSGRIVALGVTLAFCLQATVAVAVNMSLTISGFAAPIAIEAFSVQASGPSTSATGVVTPTNFSFISFSAVESAGTPVQWQMLARNSTSTSAEFQIRSTASLKLISDWTLTDVRFATVQAGRTSGGQTMTDFGLTFGKVTYRTYAADGSIVLQACWDAVAGVAC
jgi:hypothetical protein